MRPAWCRCDPAYAHRGLVDPNCPHEVFEALGALLHALDVELAHEVAHSEQVSAAYDECSEVSISDTSLSGMTHSVDAMTAEMAEKIRLARQEANQRYKGLTGWSLEARVGAAIARVLITEDR